MTKSVVTNIEKIEELYLHMIEQCKRIDALESENKALTAELKALKK